MGLVGDLCVVLVVVAVRLLPVKPRGALAVHFAPALRSAARISETDRRRAPLFASRIASDCTCISSAYVICAVVAALALVLVLVFVLLMGRM